MADFVQALPKTLAHEGGFQKNTKDWANWIGGKPAMEQYLQTGNPSLLSSLVGTKYGITAQDISKLAALGITAAIKDLTTDHATIFYRHYYWNTLYDGIANQLLAEKLFDMGVLMGVQTAVRMLQVSLTQGIILVPDGVFGPITLARTNDYGDLVTYRTVLLNHAMNIVNNNPAEAQDLGGWATRINS